MKVMLILVLLHLCYSFQLNMNLNKEIIADLETLKRKGNFRSVSMRNYFYSTLIFETLHMHIWALNKLICYLSSSVNSILNRFISLSLQLQTIPVLGKNMTRNVVSIAPCHFNCPKTSLVATLICEF